MTETQRKAVYRLLRSVLRIFLDAVDFSDIEELCLTLTDAIQAKLSDPEAPLPEQSKDDLPL